jgi:hypothetical protein
MFMFSLLECQQGLGRVTREARAAGPVARAFLFLERFEIQALE